ADTAMYRAKSLGKARHQVFDTEMHARAVNLLLLEGDLRRALEERSFEVHYQPIVRLADRSVLGFEALLRWSHPARGMIPQGEYLPLAEETGLITPIGWWVLAEACRQIAVWGDQFPQPVPLWVSVNLSARQLVQPELITEVESALAEHGLAAARLRLEITEGAVLEQSERALAAVDRLSSLGVRIDLDDFGTGYSSLSYLHRLPIDRVKIDRSFIASINEQSDSLEIVRAIIGLSRSLGMEVVAEGIEREAQATTLRALGCELAQGFFFSPPLVAREAERYLRAARR
ncbi:MAG TPA: EAL domain-containing protein, partial [Thermoanaerobaculia bacterium]|nr:EAL domain-containing protein [Thermoanaerobaculia bacterium]